MNDQYSSPKDLKQFYELLSVCGIVDGNRAASKRKRINMDEVNDLFPD